MDRLVPKAPASRAAQAIRSSRPPNVAVAPAAEPTLRPAFGIRATSIGEDAPEEQVRRAACEVGVAPDLALALIRLESGFRNDVTGAAGEIGAAQLRAGTARAYGFDLERLRSDYGYNVRAGLSLLRSMHDQFGDDASALKAYNGGPNWAALPPPTRTAVERYSNSVLQLRRQYAHIQCSD